MAFYFKFLLRTYHVVQRRNLILVVQEVYLVLG